MSHRLHAWITRGALVAAVVLGVWASTASAATGPGLIALFPFENLSRTPGAEGEIRVRLRHALEERQLPLVPDEVLAAAMADLRVRYVGGIGDNDGHGIAEKTGARAALFVTLTNFDPGDPPRLGIHARLVDLTGEAVRAVWSTSAGYAGDQTPGLFDVKQVHEPGMLVDRAIKDIADQLTAFLGGAKPRAPKAERRYAPRNLYVSREALPLSGVKRVAVLPFRNETSRRYAGEIATLELVRGLMARGIEVVEPGRVRAVMLDTRLVQQGGLSLAQADVLRGILDADLLVSGVVYEYREPSAGTEATVGFTAWGFDAARRQVAWLSRSRADGRQGVWFFDFGQAKSIDLLTGRLVDRLLEDIAKRTGHS